MPSVYERIAVALETIAAAMKPSPEPSTVTGAAARAILSRPAHPSEQQLRDVYTSLTKAERDAYRRNAVTAILVIDEIDGAARD